MPVQIPVNKDKAIVCQRIADQPKYKCATITSFATIALRKKFAGTILETTKTYVEKKGRRTFNVDGLIAASGGDGDNSWGMGIVGDALLVQPSKEGTCSVIKWEGKDVLECE